MKNLRKFVMLAAPRGAAFALTLMIYGLFIALQAHNPLTVFNEMWQGAFGSRFAWSSTLSRATPILLTSMATLIPAQLGLILIGNEGVWLLGGLTTVMTSLLLKDFPQPFAWILMFLSAFVVGGIWLMIAGAGKQWRDVDPTISSLLLSYIALACFLFLVEGPFRDPSSLNKPSTYSVPEHLRVGQIPGLGVHWGLVVGIVFAVIIFFLVYRTTFGFQSRVIGGNIRTASLLGLPQNFFILAGCFLGGGLAGVAGGFEVAAIHGNANASLYAGVGFSGILAAYVARHNPLAVILVALLLGGIESSGDLIQRRFGFSNASVDVFQGLLFLMILVAESWERFVPVKSRKMANDILNKEVAS